MAAPHNQPQTLHPLFDQPYEGPCNQPQGERGASGYRGREGFRLTHGLGSTWDRHNLPENLPRLDLYLEKVPEYLHTAVKIGDTHGHVILTILEPEDVNIIASPCFRARKKLLDKTLLVTQSTEVFPHLSLFPHKFLESNLSSPLEMIYRITKLQIKLVTLKPGCQKKTVVESFISTSQGPHLLAGRACGQTRPLASYMVWDGRFESVFRYVERWRRRERWSSGEDFKQAWLQDIREKGDVEWKWFR